MTATDTTRVIFFQVSDSASKVRHLAETAYAHFSRKEHFLIIADDDKALAFVDELLWNHSPEIFLPHTIVLGETQEWIALTKEKKNVNNARFAFNLCATPLMIEGPFRVIYEYEDGSSPNKKNLSISRFEAYKKAQFIIESRT